MRCKQGNLKDMGRLKEHNNADVEVSGLCQNAGSIDMEKTCSVKSCSSLLM